MSADPIYTLADLDSWAFPGTALAVLGHPIKHSVSPQMHNAALAEMAKRDPRFASWKYFRFDIAPEDLPVALKKFHACGFYGLNLTVPHKTLAYEYCQSRSETAQSAQAVNTIVSQQNGWRGHNTDGYGLISAIKEDLGISIDNQVSVLLLGAGGAAKGAAVDLLDNNVRYLSICNRTALSADAVINQLRFHWNLTGPEVRLAKTRPEDIHDLPVDREFLVINATSAGLNPSDAPPIDLSSMPRPPRAVYDMIYNPPETPLLAQARALRIPAANGLGMLVHQGARALEIWSETAVPVAAMRAAVDAAMRARG